MKGERNIEIKGDAYRNIIVTGDGNTITVLTTHQTEEEPRARPSEIGPNPYVGLAAFDEKDVERFFGRRDFVERLWAAFSSLHKTAPGRPSAVRILPILGPSGSGKSSVVRAGLLPKLAAQPLPLLKSPRVIVFEPGAHPLDSLAKNLARLAMGDAAPVAKAREFKAELLMQERQGEFDGLRRIVDSLPEIETSGLVLLVDQFEQIYTLCQQEHERQAFGANLLHAAADPSSHLSVILTLRSDFLGETRRHAELNRVISEQGLLVPVMSASELREAIARPAQEAGRPFEEPLVEELLAQTKGREGALPLLQFALEQIWARMADGCEPAAALLQIKGVGGALAEKAKEIYESLDGQQQLVARQVFLSMINVGEGVRDTQRRVKVAEMLASGQDARRVREVLHAFSRADARIITLATGLDGEETAEITHEALLEHWETLQQWLAEERGDLLFARRLEIDARDWNDAKRPAGLLWRSPKLELLGEFQARRGLTGLQSEFYRESHRQAQIEKRKRRRRAIVAVAAAALAVTAGYLWQSARNSQRLFDVERRVSFARQLAADAKAALAQQPNSLQLPLLLAIESARRYPLVEADEVLQQGLRLLPRLSQTIAAPADLLLYSQDDRYVAVASGHTVQLWEAGDFTRRETIFKAEGERGRIAALAFGPNDARLAIVVNDGDDGQVHLLSLEGGQNQAKNIATYRAAGPVLQITFSPDGKFLAVRDRREIVLLEAISGEVISALRREGGMNDLAFSPDNRSVATAGADGSACLWGAPMEKDLADHKRQSAAIIEEAVPKRLPGDPAIPAGEHANRLAEQVLDKLHAMQLTRPRICFKHNGAVASVAFSRSGAELATASLDKRVRLWDATAGKERANLEQEQAVYQVAFDHGGKLLAASDKDGTVRVWTADGKQEVQRLPIKHQGRIVNLVFAQDDRQLIVSDETGIVTVWTFGSSQTYQLSRQVEGAEKGTFAISANGQTLLTPGDKTVHVWNLAIEQGPVVFPNNVAVTASALSPDGRYLATAERIDGAEVVIRDVAVRRQLHRLPLEKPICFLAFSTDGKYLAAAGGEKFSALISEESRPDYAVLWDVGEGREVARIPHQDVVTAVAFSSDAKLVATAGFDGIARVWNVESRREVYAKEHEAPLLAVAFSPDGKLVATSTEDRDWTRQRTAVIRVWEAVTGREIMKVEQVPVAREIFFSADGKLLVTADGNSLIKEDSPFSASIGLAEVWEVASGNEIAEFRPFVGEVYSAALSPDGRRAATINQYGEIQFWDVGQSKGVWSARHSVNAWASLAFSPDGRHLFSIASDGTARVWSADSGQELSRFGHGGPLYSGAIAPRSRSFAAAGDKSIERWQWETGKEDEACRRLTRNLNDQEWKQYLGKEPYPRTCAELPENSAAKLQGEIEQTPRKVTLRKAETWWNRLLEVVPYKLIGFVILLRVVIWVLGGLPRAEKESGARNE